MCRIIGILYLCVLLPYWGLAQRSNNWCFGLHCGINFNQSPAEPFQCSIYGINSYSGSTYPQAISDCKGNLLFYTGGDYIWNREHKLLPSGKDLAKNNGNNIFVPAPGDDSLYYLFQAYNDSFQLSYLLIDLRQDSGRGDVVKRVEFSDSNGTFGGFIKHANDTDYWILFSTSAFTIQAYLLTKSGLSKKPVSSPFKGGLGLGNSPYMRSSNNGKLIISDGTQNDFKYKYFIYDFDKSSGKLNNPRPLILKTDIRVWQFSFSPNDSILYGIKTVPADSIYIYQIAAYDNQPYKSIKEIFSFKRNYCIWSSQLGPDNRLYIDASTDSLAGKPSISKHRSISYIPYPDTWGKGCGFVMDGMYFNFDSANVFSQKFPCHSFPIKRINNKFAVTGTDNCAHDDDTLNFIADADSAFKSYNWYFGDGDSAVGKSVVHQYKNAGSYYVKLGCELGNCGYLQWVGDSVTIKFKPTIALNTNKTIYCGYQAIAAKINYRYSDTIQVAWGDGTDTLLYVADTNLVDSVQLQHLYTKTGNYALSCKAWNSNCYDSVATVYNIKIETLPKASFAANYTTSCGAKTISFLDTSKFDSVIINRTWHIYKANGLDTTINTGTVNNLPFLFNDTGIYSVKLIMQSKQGCTDSLEKINYIQINPIPVSKIIGKTKWCGTDSTTLTVTGGMGYIWSTGDTTASVFLKPVTSNYYSVLVTNIYNCSVKDSVFISVGKIVTPYFTPNYITSCGNSTITLTDSSGGMDSIIQQRKWTIYYPNNIVKQYDTVSTNKLKLIVQDTGYYNAKLIYITKQGCTDSLYKAQVFRILPQPIVYIDSPSHNPLCFGDSFILTAKQKDINYPPLVKYKWNAGQVATPSIKVDTANSYYVAAVNTFGCGAQSNTVKISFLPQLFVNIKTASNRLYTVTTRPVVSYTWYKDNMLYDSTSSIYYPPTGRYYVHVVDGNGCVANSGSLLHIGLNNIAYMFDGIRVYPNPANDKLYISAENIKTVYIYNLLGELVHQSYFAPAKPIDISALPNGLYLLKTEGALGEKSITKFLKE